MTARQFIAPTILIGVGLTPMLVWLGLLIWALVSPVVGEGIYLVAASGIAAYLATFVISGAGCLWADRALRRSQLARPRSTAILIQIVAAFLVLPWLLLPLLGFVSKVGV